MARQKHITFGLADIQTNKMRTKENVIEPLYFNLQIMPKRFTLNTSAFNYKFDYTLFADFQAVKN